MKTIGLIGGMSWESSALYYRMINEETKRLLSGHHNAPSLVDATAAAIKQFRQKRVGLLGTRFTMEEAFYADRMRNQFGIDLLP